jgi:predicted dehydrogenase
MRVGVLGTGWIVHPITAALKGMTGVECYAIASRTKERGEQAAKEFGYKVGYGSYEELVADPKVDLVYVATPHSRHYEDMKLCIAAGKNVLCEKSFTLNAVQAADIKRLAKEAGVYVAEAIWTRYQPSRKLINDTIASGIIGEVKTLTANLSYAMMNKERIWNPELAGGALLDIGVYGINFALMHFGDDIDHIESSVQMLDTGVDGMESITIFFKDGRMAVLTHSVYGRSDRKGIFYGEKGYMIVENINNPQSISVYDAGDNLLQFIPVPEQINGYEYQFAEAADCIEAGKLESDSMPLADSVKVMQVMDALRKQWGMVYPQER